MFSLFFFAPDYFDVFKMFPHLSLYILSPPPPAPGLFYIYLLIPPPPTHTHTRPPDAAEKRAAFLAGAHAAGIDDEKRKQGKLEIDGASSLPRKELVLEKEKVVEKMLVEAGRFGGGGEKAATMGGQSKVVGEGECSLEAPPPDGARTPVRGACL